MSEEPVTVGGYELHNCVATGATTQIWEVSEPSSGTQLVMKMLLEEVRKNSAERSVLKHEFKVGSSLQHPLFLKFHQIEINRDHSFFIMDFYRSPNLKSHLISNLPGLQSGFKPLAESLTQAYQYMHEAGWLHRDIKPENILVSKSGEARVIDFSLSCKVKTGLALKMAGKQKTIQGTRTYIAPETILRKTPTPQTDIYNLGVTLFEVLTGVPPFAGDSPSALLKKHLGEDVVEPSAFNSNVTKMMDQVILKMLAKKPADRYATMQEVERAIHDVRCFEVDPLQLRAQELAEAKKLQTESVDKRLNSRADAERTAKGIKAPVAKSKKKRVDPRVIAEEERRLEKEAAKKQAAAPAPEIPQQQPMPQQPMFPGKMPGQQMPPMGYPQMPMQQPAMPMQPGMGYPQAPMQPGMVPPGQPGMPMPPGVPMQQPPQGMPQPAMPPQQPMPQQPVQQQPAAPQPVQQPIPQQPAPTQPAPQPTSAEEPEEATLDDMAGFDIE